MSTPRKRTTKTKSEIENEFGDVAEKHAGKTILPAKEAEAKAAHEREVLAKVLQLTPDRVISSIGGVQLDITKTLSQVSEILVEKTQELQAVNEAIAIRTAELEQLHGKDVVASALDLLLAQHEEEKKRLEEEITTARASWDKEYNEQQQAEAERAVQLKKDREREAQEHDYKTKMERRGDADRWNDHVRAIQLQERDRGEALQKNWKEREDALKAKEDEFVRLQNEVAAHPDKLKKEVDRNVAIVTNTMTKDHKHEMQILTQQAQSQHNLLASELTQERKVSATLEAQVKELTAKLAEANQKNTEIATKALESASGQSALAAVQKFAAESGSNGPSKRS